MTSDRDAYSLSGIGMLPPGYHAAAGTFTTAKDGECGRTHSQSDLKGWILFIKILEEWVPLHGKYSSQVEPYFDSLKLAQDAWAD